MTLLTVVTHRVRQLRQRKADRAPRDVVAGTSPGFDAFLRLPTAFLTRTPFYTQGYLYSFGAPGREKRERRWRLPSTNQSRPLTRVWAKGHRTKTRRRPSACPSSPFLPNRRLFYDPTPLRPDAWLSSSDSFLVPRHPQQPPCRYRHQAGRSMSHSARNARSASANSRTGTVSTRPLARPSQ